MTSEQGLDYEFLRYIGVTPETQKRVQRLYLPFFEGCEMVVDLGCGDGDFLELLKERGVEAIGVDRDRRCWAAARERGLEVICKDIFDYLEELDEESVEGIFSAHLVEHLPYEKVIELFRLSYRALKKGGRIVITTPNVRGLIAHLEMFYLHFGHVSFYHPKLLCFFLEHVRFEATERGENPETASPLLADIGLGSSGGAQPFPLVEYELQLPLSKDTPIHRMIRSCKMFLVRLVVQPYLDRVVASVNRSLAQVAKHLARVKELDRPFECYVTAIKG